MAHSSDGALKPRGFSGTLLRPGDPGYDEARRVHNAMVDRRPALIARCARASDAAAVVDLARGNRLPLSVYGGGHGVTGAAVCDAGICLDLRGMKGVWVDPKARVARVQAGLTWGELDAANQAHGLAVTGGRVSTTGVAGLVLGSGSGWLERKLGLTCDSLISAEVVTAEGRVVRTSERENADLFWGLRGGSGNFGVVTEFTFRLHPVGPIVLGGMLIHPAERAAELLAAWRNFMQNAPDEVGSGFGFVTAPPGPPFPEELRGKPCVVMVVCYAGPVLEGEKALAPLVALGPPAANLVAPMPYVALQRMLDEASAPGLQNYWTADFFSDLPDEAVETLAAGATRPVSPRTQVFMVMWGGAVARAPEEATALARRGAPWNIHYLSAWPDPAHTAQNVAWTRALAGSMKPWSTGGVYLNFIGDEGTARVRAAYGEEKFERLQRLKAKWDPENLFRLNQNIPPALPAKRAA